MALFRCSSGGGGASSGGVDFVETPIAQAINTAKTYNNLEVGKTYTYFCIQSGSRDCGVGSVTNGTFTEKEKYASSSLSYSVYWIVPTSSSITITMSSSSSGVILKTLFG